MRVSRDLTQFERILPYASELFGVYQPLIGWRSRRIQSWIKRANQFERVRLLDGLADQFRGLVDLRFNADQVPELASIDVGQPVSARAGTLSGSVLVRQIAGRLPPGRVPPPAEWDELLNQEHLVKVLREEVYPFYTADAGARLRKFISAFPRSQGESDDLYSARLRVAVEGQQGGIRGELERESALAGVLNQLARRQMYDQVAQFFFVEPMVDQAKKLERLMNVLGDDFQDPYLAFDPKKDIGDVSLSPIGIVHLYRQYFFEFETFLGTPTGHVWLSPGASVELVETTTRRTLTERTTEEALEKIVRSETSSTTKDDLSDAVKEDNRDDVKLGISSTVNQSWGTGSASATASLNMDRTQQVAREKTHKRSREQTEKLSSEIRQNFKTTFKIVTEVTDTSSKRYVLANSTGQLINYEMRRKMRQVGVQVQDVGTYLCWQTFVDEPGRVLGLANLVHLAKPADLVPQPNAKEIPNPPDRVEKPFQTGAVWNFGDNRKYNDPALGFVELTVIPLPVQPDTGYEVADPEGEIAISVVSYSGEDSENQRYRFRGKLVGGSQVRIGVVTGPGGIEWDERIDFVVGGAIAFKPTAAKLKEISDANAEILKTSKAADRENERRNAEAFVKAAKDRIKLASQIRKRKYEDLREEERIVVYRFLIRSLMTDTLYELPESDDNDRVRHVLSELINSIFDVDKMLYFVAPEWWKPRDRNVFTGATGLSADAVVGWTDQVLRPNNYNITDESEPASLGSSLGWLLQLDGDNLRNAFLNAPWVKAVIPIRPGKERAAIAWLQNTNVEGVEGLDGNYLAPPGELQAIRDGLLAADPSDPVGGRPNVTLFDAIRFLCLEVERKHAAEIKVEKYPKDLVIDDANKVSSTPIEKVYEHGFYPLQGGFRAIPGSETPGEPGDPDRHFQVFDQWIEILPTDQVVPVPVAYDPKTGRQL